MKLGVSNYDALTRQRYANMKDGMWIRTENSLGRPNYGEEPRPHWVTYILMSILIPNSLFANIFGCYN